MVPSLSEMELLILTELFVEDQKSPYGVSIDELKESLDSQFVIQPPRKIAIALGTLRSKQFAEREEFENGTWGWKITAIGTETFAEIISADQNETHITSNVDSYDAWTPLPLDRHEQPLEAAAEKIDELAEAVAQDNGYAATEPEERNFILSALHHASKALREQSTIYRIQFDAFIWGPLNKLADRFHKTSIGVLAEAARELIKEALKHAAKSWWS